MSHNAPPPPLATPILRKRGNRASRYGQAPLNLHQAFSRADPSSQPSSDQSNSSSNSQSRDRQASERVSNKHDHVPGFGIQSASPGQSPKTTMMMTMMQNPKDSARLSPADACIALEDWSTESGSKESPHLAHLTTGDHATSQGFRQSIEKADKCPLLPADKFQTCRIDMAARRVVEFGGDGRSILRKGGV